MKLQCDDVIMVEQGVATCNTTREKKTREKTREGKNLVVVKFWSLEGAGRHVQASTKWHRTEMAGR